jgi:hypothetical protein
MVQVMLWENTLQEALAGVCRNPQIGPNKVIAGIA